MQGQSNYGQGDGAATSIAHVLLGSGAAFGGERQDSKDIDNPNCRVYLSDFGTVIDLKPGVRLKQRRLRRAVRMSIAGNRERVLRTVFPLWAALWSAGS